MGDHLSADYIRKIARLSRLTLRDEDVPRYQDQLSSVLNYIERLRSVDLAGVEPMAHVGDTRNRYDEDTPGETLPNETLMNMAPLTMPPFVKVPKVFDDGGGA